MEPMSVSAKSGTGSDLNLLPIEMRSERILEVCRFILDSIYESEFFLEVYNIKTSDHWQAQEMARQLYTDDAGLFGNNVYLWDVIGKYKDAFAVFGITGNDEEAYSFKYNGEVVLLI